MTISIDKNTALRREAREEARRILESGANPDWLVEVLYYPRDYPGAEEGIMGLGNPTPPDTDMSGHTSWFYRLADLAGEDAVPAAY